jgi:hypothetical protein
VRPVGSGAAGEAGGFEIGAQYRSLGKRLDRVVDGTAAKRDQEGSEMWLARRFGVVRLRVSQSELSDNVDRNPVLPRTTRSQTGFTAELAMEAWPMFSLGYSAGDAERTRLGSLTGRPGTGAGLYHDLVLGLRPSDSITVAPAVSFGQEHYQGSGTQWDTGSASVAVPLAPPAGRRHPLARPVRLRARQDHRILRQGWHACSSPLPPRPGW